MPVPNQDLYYDNRHNLLKFQAMYDLDLPFDCNWFDDKWNTMLMFLHNHWYDKMHNRWLHVIRLMGKLLHYDRSWHRPNQLLYDIADNRAGSFVPNDFLPNCNSTGDN